MIREEFRIKELCRQRDMTLADLAGRLGITPVAMAQLMGRENTTTDKLKEIAGALGVNWWELIKTDESTPTGGSYSVACPHCGKMFTLCVEAKK